MLTGRVLGCFRPVAGRTCCAVTLCCINHSISNPVTYKISAVIFDANKTPGYICTLTKGEGEDNEIYLGATATNWTEAESDLLTITEATDITLKAGGSDTTGLDVIMIYASVDAPDDPEGIVEVKSAQKVAARKVMKDGRILIQTEGGIFNAIGVQVK